MRSEYKNKGTLSSTSYSQIYDDDFPAHISIHSVGRVKCQKCVVEDSSTRFGDLHRISTVKCGIMKFARMLSEGDVPLKYQLNYWRTIATWSRKEKYDYVLRLSHVARDNMTNHMKLAMLSSLKQHTKVFDKKDELWATNVKLTLGWQPRTLEAQGLFSICHEHNINIPSEVLQFLATSTNNNKTALKFITMVAGMHVMTTWQQRCVVLVQFIMSFDITTELTRLLQFESFQVSKIRIGQLEAQGATMEDNKEHIISALLGVLGHAFKVQAPHEVYRDIVRVKRIESLARLCSSTATLIRFFQLAMSWITDVGEAYCRDMDIHTLYLTRVDKEIPGWMKEVGDLYETNGLVRAGIEYSTAMRVRQLHQKGSEFVRYAQKAQVPSQQLVAFSTVYRQCSEMLKNSDAFFGSDKLRPEPFLVYIYGSSGQGKSTLIHMLASDLLKKMEIPYNRERDYYARNPAQDHWDGYANQTLVLFDDFLQSRKSDDRVKEVLEIIRIKNNQPFPLKMAELANKGNTKFTSPLVFITSNTDVTGDINITDIDAMKRRRDVVVEVSIKREFKGRNGFVDTSKVLSKSGKEISRSVYEFIIRSALTGEALITFSKYSEFISYLVTAWTRLKLHERQIESAIEEDYMKEELEAEKRAQEEATVQDYFSVMDSPPQNSLNDPPDSPKLPLTIIAQGNFMEALGAAEGFLRDKGYIPHHDLAVKLASAVSHHESGITQKDWMDWTPIRKNFLKAKEWISLNLKEIRDPDTWSYISKGLSFVGVALGILLAIYTNKKEEVEECEAFGSGDSKTIMTRKETKIKKGSIAKEAQGCSDARGLDLIKRTFMGMLCQIVIERGNGKRNAINGILIGSRLIMVPYHLFLMTEEGYSLTVKTANNDFKLEMEEAIYYPYKDHDMAIMVMPRRFPMFPKQTQHFIDERDVGKFYLQNVAMLQLHCNLDMKVPVMQMVGNTRIDKEIDYELRGGEIHELHLAEGFKYDIHSVVGDCGSPLIWLHASVNRKIIGFHVAGGDGTGVSNIITHELAEKVYQTHSGVVLEAQSFTMVDPDYKMGVGNIKGLQFEGVVEDKNQFRQPTKTTIKPSIIHGVFPPTTAPAILRPVDGVSPLELGVRKSAVPAVMIPCEMMDWAANEVLVHYETGKVCMERRILTMDESINGVAGNNWVRPLNMKTSPGYPYILSRKQSGKYDLFTFEDDKWKPTEFMIEKIVQREKDAQAGKITPTMFVDVLKDERRPLDKVAEMKTRIFNTAPVDLNILIRKYFCAFAAHIMENHITHEIAVGINYHSEEWGLLYRRLRSGGDRWLAGDYSNYDKMFPRQIMIAIADIANRWYNDEHSKIREVLMDTLACRYHLTNKCVFYHIHGNPSGNPLTVILNSIGNMILMRIAWYHLATRYGPEYKFRFGDFVKLSVYGDDNVATVSRVITWYNCVSISGTLEMYGMIYTPPKTQASGTLVPYLNAEEVTYLKRYFRQVGSHVFAPLQLEVIHEIPNWIRISHDDREATLVNVEMALQEMFHHGEEAYMALRDKLTKACAKKGVVPTQYPFSYYFEKWLGGELSDNDPLHLKCDLTRTAHGCGSATLDCGASISSRPGKNGTIKLVAQANTIENIAQNEHKGGDNTQQDRVITANEEATTSTIYPTTFEDMAEVRTEDFSQNQSDLQMMTYPMPTLKGFLERPFMLSSGTWKSSNPAGSSLFSFSLPRDLFAIASVFSKIKYFTYFRGDFKIGIRINGTKFHYGRLMMAWLPYTRAVPYLNIRSLSCNKHIIASPSENEVREMVVPFAYPSMYYSLASLGGIQAGSDVGTVIGMVLNPLQEGSVTNDVNYTIYVSCVDPKLDGPTSAEIPKIIPQPQIIFPSLLEESIGNPERYDICAGGQITPGHTAFGMGKNSTISDKVPFRNFVNVSDPGLTYAIPHDMALMEERLSRIRLRERTEAEFKSPKPSLTKKVSNLQAQGKTMESSSMQQEAIQKSDGVISGVALGVSRSLNALSQVPSFGALKAGASVMSGIGNFAAKFGFCKPTTVAADTLVRPKCLNMSYGAGIDNGTKLSTLPDNGVMAAAQWMGGNDKEMDIKHIAQTPSYLGSVKWTAAAARGTEIFVWPVCPQSESGDFGTVSTKLSTYNGVPSMVSFVSKQFKYWRGSLRYTFQIVASGFHSGRIRISFEPYGLLSGIDTFSAEEGMNAPNIVIDVQKETEVAIEVPYVYHNLWARGQEFIGVLHMDVINPLTHSQDVCPPVFVNVWVAGGDNIAFARFSGDVAVPTQAIVARDLWKADGEDKLEQDEHVVLKTLKKVKQDEFACRMKLEAQGLSLEETRKGPFIPLAPCNHIEDNGICMGEKITHVKELTNIPQRMRTAYINVNGTAGTNTITNNIISPWNFVVPATPVQLPSRAGPFEWFKNIFMFGRGSINVKMVPRYRYNKEIAVRMNNLAGSGVFCFLEQGRQLATNDVEVMIPNNNNPFKLYQMICNNPLACQVSPVGMDIEFTIPYYSPNVCIPLTCNNGDYDKLTSIAEVPYVIPMYTGFNRMLANDTTKFDYIEYDIFYSTGDDFVFGNLIGPPMMFYYEGYYDSFVIKIYK